MTFVRAVFASTNAPESAKRGLLRDRLRRARLLYRFYANHDVDVAAVQEAGTYAEIVDAEVKGLKAIWAKANSIVKGRRVGNGIIGNRVRFKIRKLEDIPVGDLNIAVAQITHRRTGFTWRHIAIHRRTRRDDPSGEDRTAMNIALRGLIKSIDREGGAWVVAGDANEGEQWAIADLGKTLGQHGVDHIIGSKHFIALGQEVIDRPRLSDHAFVLARVAFEA
jgi:hypothetical protein